MSLPKEYLNQTIVLVDNGIFVGGTTSDNEIKNIKVRWDDQLMEAVDINDEYVLTVASVKTDETDICATVGIGSALVERFYMWKDGKRYRIAQHRVYTDVSGKESYRELLVAPDTPT